MGTDKQTREKIKQMKSAHIREEKEGLGILLAGALFDPGEVVGGAMPRNRLQLDHSK